MVFRSTVATGLSGGEAAHAPRTSAAGPIRLRTLVLMRWIAVAGQTSTILIVYFYLEYYFPLLATLAVVGASVVLNVFLMFRYAAAKRLGDREAGLSLVYDILQLGALLFLTGGLHNPFSFLLITGAIISAAVLSVRTTVALIGLSLILGSVLTVVHLPLPWPEGYPSFIESADVPHLEPGAPRVGRIIMWPLPEVDGEHPIPHVYVFGIWCAFAFGMVFFAAYIMRVAEEGRRMSDALMETRMALAHEQQLSTIGGLAAAAAHDLGTPLGTIAVIAKELSLAIPPDSPYVEDARLLISQSERCRDILARLTPRSAEGGSPFFHRLPLMTLVEMAAGSPRRAHVAVSVEHDPALALNGRSRDRSEGHGLSQPIVSYSPEIGHALENLIENAAHFAKTLVSIKVGWSDRKIVVEIADDGPGFARDILGALGEPYVSTRRDAGGMGLGVFIAKTLLERTGAEIELGNRAEGGARIVIAWPRSSFEETPVTSADGSSPVEPEAKVS